MTWRDAWVIIIVVFNAAIILDHTQPMWLRIFSLVGTLLLVWLEGQARMLKRHIADLAEISAEIKKVEGVLKNARKINRDGPAG